MATYVHNSGVDVAELLEAEKSGAMGGIIEGEGGGGIDGNSTSIGRWIRRLTSVKPTE
jgi:hypothetical protein